MTVEEHHITRVNFNKLRMEMEKIDPDWLVKISQSKECIKMVSSYVLRGTSLENNQTIQEEAWKATEVWMKNMEAEQELYQYQLDYSLWKNTQVKFEKPPPDYGDD
jgi:hypothetical protein